MKVMFVDDDTSVLQIRKRLAKARRLDCVAFTYPVEALEHLDGVDVVVTDFNFGPGNINGNEFIRLARQKRPDCAFTISSSRIRKTASVAHWFCRITVRASRGSS